jgi:microcystin-dependent protein
VDECYIGAIILFAGNFAPQGWAFCDGQLLPIAQYDALFTLLGTTYGGDGQETFALPDLRGRIPIHFGQGPGLSNYALGQKGGAETHTLTMGELAAHTHTATVQARAGAGDSSAAAGGVWAGSSMGDKKYSDATPNTTMRAGIVNVAPTGGGQPHDNMQPALGLNFIIALEGVYPPQS